MLSAEQENDPNAYIQDRGENFKINSHKKHTFCSSTYEKFIILNFYVSAINI